MKTNTSQTVSEEVLDRIVKQYSGKPGELLSTLEEVQEIHPFRYLPEETLRDVSRKLAVPLTQVYSVATFYSFFNLKPQGKHSIVVCRGTACHTKGSRALLSEVSTQLGFRYEPEDGEPVFTTPDNEYTIKTVACFGQCAQSPVIAIDGEIFSNVNAQKLLRILKKIKS